MRRSTVRSGFALGVGSALTASALVAAGLPAAAEGASSSAPARAAAAADESRLNTNGPHPNLPRLRGDELTPPPCTYLDNPQIDEFTGYEEMTAKLHDLEETARFDVDVSSFGKSNRGRDLWQARVGTGDEVFLVQAEIHGNEKVGPDAIFRMLDWLGNSNSRAARDIRHNLTVVAIPKINPDGAELDQRQTDRTWAEVVADFPQLEGVEPAWNYTTRSKAPGFDLNRDFHPDLNYVPQPEDFPGSSAGFGWFINPESQALRDLYIELQGEYGEVDYFVDVHHQGPCVADAETRELVDIGVDYPPLPDWEFEEGGKYAEFPNTQDESRRLAMSGWTGITEGGYKGNRYLNHPPERDIPGQARSAFALNGSATVLFEIRGQTQSLGQEGRERFTRATVAGLFGMMHDTATGALNDYDPTKYDELPGNVNLRPESWGAQAGAAAND